jgi:flavorubredoxin
MAVTLADRVALPGDNQPRQRCYSDDLALVRARAKLGERYGNQDRRDCGRVYRLSTFFPDMPPFGFTFNQFLIEGDEPLLFNCGMRGTFPLVSAAVARIVPVQSLRWITFGHVEADECGAMNSWLAAAPRAQVAHGMVACMVSLNDLANRTPRAPDDGDVLDLGGKRVRYIDTPHVPHCWEAGETYAETTGTLLCGDLFTHLGDGPALTGSDIVGPAITAEDKFHATSIGAATAPTIRKLAALKPRTLGVMHGSSFNGDCTGALGALADYYAAGLRKMAA